METLAPEQREVYAKSMSSAREAGRVALVGSEVEVVQQSLAYAEMLIDFKTAAQENITTDPEFGPLLYFAPERWQPMGSDGVMYGEGKYVRDLLRSGTRASRLAASKDPKMNVQVIRDEADEEVGDIVDNLRKGQLYAVLSYEPIEAIEENSEFWEDEMNYRRGMAVLQVYHHRGDVMYASTHSIKRSDKQLLSAMMNKRYGTAIASDEHSSNWIRHGILMEANDEEAQAFGMNFRNSYRAELGEVTPQYSVTRFMEMKQDQVVGFFDSYMIPLARAVASGKNEPVLAGFAKSMLQNVQDLSSGDVRQLVNIALGSKFTEDDGRLMEGMLRYGFIETIRDDLKLYIMSQGKVASRPRIYESHYGGNIHNATQFTADMSSQHYMNAALSQGIQRGFSAQRSYGGCAGAGKNYGDKNDSGDLEFSERQDVYGGRLNAKEDKETSSNEETNSLSFECPKGHTNWRPNKKTYISHCTTCDCYVGCGIKEAIDIRPFARRQERSKQNTAKATIASLFRVDLAAAA